MATDSDLDSGLKPEILRSLLLLAALAQLHVRSPASQQGVDPRWEMLQQSYGQLVVARLSLAQAAARNAGRTKKARRFCLRVRQGRSSGSKHSTQHDPSASWNEHSSHNPLG